MTSHLALPESWTITSWILALVLLRWNSSLCRIPNSGPLFLGFLLVYPPYPNPACATRLHPLISTTALDQSHTRVEAQDASCPSLSSSSHLHPHPIPATAQPATKHHSTQTQTPSPSSHPTEADATTPPLDKDTQGHWGFSQRCHRATMRDGGLGHEGVRRGFDLLAIGGVWEHPRRRRRGREWRGTCKLR